jgi:asparagine synthase (glutamine-hydrolysing)
MGQDLAAEALEGFDIQRWVNDMTGALPDNMSLALSQIESTAYLRNQLLRDSDWASMDHGVELRTPLVDAWLLRRCEPVLSTFSRFANKTLLAEAPKKPLPSDIVLRPKTGFAIPLSNWLRHDTRSARQFGSGSRAWSKMLSKVYAADTIG